MMTYVIMKQRSSPIAIYSAQPHDVVGSLKEARDAVKNLEKRATTNMYWYVKVKNSLTPETIK